MSNSILSLISRIFLAIVFIPAGLQKLMGGIEGTAGYISSVGLPAGTALAWIAGIFEVAAGIAILVGFQTRIASYLLAAFCLFTGFVFHYLNGGGDQMQMIMFFKNIGLAGGFLSLAVAGAGGYSVDARR